MKNLIKMTDFVLEQGTEINTGEMFYIRTYNYAKFLKQPLELGMFVPCDEDSSVVEYIKNPYEIFCDKENVCRVISKEEIKYQKAKERVLFEECPYDLQKMEKLFLINILLRFLMT